MTPTCSTLPHGARSPPAGWSLSDSFHPGLITTTVNQDLWALHELSPSPHRDRTGHFEGKKGTKTPKPTHPHTTHTSPHESNEYSGFTQHPARGVYVHTSFTALGAFVERWLGGDVSCLTSTHSGGQTISYYLREFECVSRISDRSGENGGQRGTHLGIH